MTEAGSFIGEHLIPGKIGHLSVIATFLFSCLGIFSYLQSHRTKNGQESWSRLGNLSSIIVIIGTLSIGITLFYIMLNHYFEYYYAWAHTSLALPYYYMISSFWEGQEGSFWLWMFWQAILMLVILWRNKQTPHLVMLVLLLSQAFLSSMLLGTNFFGIRIGSSPFILLRHAIEGPIFAQTDYLSFIRDGKGLNPLLQSYWMVIHPPILFLGFSATIVPLAYTFSGALKQNFLEHINKTKQWLLFSIITLGTGILLGSFWAYEALNFGGYWAWDPVENASIVPWIIAIVALHLLIVFKNTGRYSLLTAIFICSTFLLVLYASFLTRSGILGDSSAHSFTDLGLSEQLLFYLFGFTVLSLFICLKFKKQQHNGEEEKAYSREFWIFLGSCILALAACQILATTSIPVFNAVFGTSLAPPSDIMEHYNKWQYLFLLFLFLLVGNAMLSRYRIQNGGKLFKKALYFLLLSILTGGLLSYYWNIHNVFLFTLLIITACYSLLINGYQIIKRKNRTRLSGATISHIGFAIMILGIVVSGLNKKVLSINTAGYDYGEEFERGNNSGENILLFKNEPFQMGNYLLTYAGDSIASPDTFYTVRFQQKTENNKPSNSFTLKPKAQNNAEMGLIASPDLHSTFMDNLYVHVSMVPIEDQSQDKKERLYSAPTTITIRQGESFRFSNHNITLSSIEETQEMKNMKLEGDNKILNPLFKIESIDGSQYIFQPNILLYNDTYISLKNIFDLLEWKFEVLSYNQANNEITFLLFTPRIDQKKYIVLKALLFPFINLYWGGTLIMLLGGFLSWRKRP